MTPNQEIEEMKEEIVQLKAILHTRTRSNKAIGDEGESIVAEMIQQFYPSAFVQSTARAGSTSAATTASLLLPSKYGRPTMR